MKVEEVLPMTCEQIASRVSALEDTQRLLEVELEQARERVRLLEGDNESRRDHVRELVKDKRHLQEALAETEQSLERSEAQRRAFEATLRWWFAQALPGGHPLRTALEVELLSSDSDEAVWKARLECAAAQVINAKGERDAANEEAARLREDLEAIRYACEVVSRERAELELEVDRLRKAFEEGHG